MTKAKNKSVAFYLRDWWGEGTGWVRRKGYNYLTLTDAKRGARELAKHIGKGARVQIVRVTQEVVHEVKS